MISVMHMNSEQTEEPQNQKKMWYGIALVMAGIVLMAVSRMIIGSDALDFISGLLCGICLAIILIGVYIVGKWLGSNKITP